jgi:hypothetical protein
VDDSHVAGSSNLGGRAELNPISERRSGVVEDAIQGHPTAASSTGISRTREAAALLAALPMTGGSISVDVADAVGLRDLHDRAAAAVVIDESDHTVGDFIGC